MIIVSFLIHIILLIVVYYLYNELKLLKNEKTNEITDLFEFYLEEIKDENTRLQAEYVTDQTQKEIKTKAIANDDSSSMITEHVTDNTEEEIKYEPLVNIDDSYETSLQAQILQLNNQGLTSEEIAEKLQCGKTEAALVIKLHSKKKS